MTQFKTFILLIVVAMISLGCAAKTNEFNFDEENVEVQSIEEAESMVSFMIREPEVPFEISDKTIRVVNVSSRIQAVEVSYTQTEDRSNLVLMMNNSNIDNPQGERGDKLDSGAQTYNQGDGHVSVLFWEHDKVNYLLISGQVVNENMVPLYTQSELIEIANTIQ